MNFFRRKKQAGSPRQKSLCGENAGETACATTKNQQFAKLVGQAFSLPRLLPQAASLLTADLRRRIRSSFEEAARDEEHFPSTIDPRIYHVQLILEFFGDLAGKRVLDAGCGKGRFARVLAERHPHTEICGLEITVRFLLLAGPSSG